VVLEVTPMRGTEEGVALRVHASGKGRRSSSDVMSPWESEPVQAEPDVPRCVRIRLTLDAWEPARSVTVPGGATEPYKVEVVGGT
jgi:hypothetical protein